MFDGLTSIWSQQHKFHYLNELWEL